MDDRGSKLLGQFQITGSGTPASAYTVPAGRRALIYEIHCSNNAATAQTAGLYLDQGGTTYNAANIYWPDISVPANSAVHETFEKGLELDATDSIGVDSDANTTTVFTILGQEFDNADVVN